MLDVPAGLEDHDADESGRSWEPSALDPLCTRLAVGIGDTPELVCVGTARDHLGRRRRCAWHLVLHRHRDGDWTHLYRVLPDHGRRVLVLLDRALAGDARAVLRHHARRSAGRMTRNAG